MYVYCSNMEFSICLFYHMRRTDVFYIYTFVCSNAKAVTVHKYNTLKGAL